MQMVSSSQRGRALVAEAVRRTTGFMQCAVIGWTLGPMASELARQEETNTAKKADRTARTGSMKAGLRAGQAGASGIVVGAAGARHGGAGRADGAPGHRSTDGKATGKTGMTTAVKQNRPATKKGSVRCPFAVRTRR
ncbi:hypothetical protein JCM10599A_25470 [Paraburkholderia kururiensis]